MSFVLVVVAAIALVIGLLQSGLGIIYVSIACSVLAGIVLVVAVLRGRPEGRPAARPAPRPAAEGAPPPPAPTAAETTAAETTMVSTPAAPPPPPAPSPEREPAMAGASRGWQREAAAGTATADHTEQLEQAEIEEAVELDDGFPIHDYDKLRATEILPILAELDEEQLEAVRQREQAGKNRFMILSRIDDELQSREGEGWDVEDEGWTGEQEDEEDAAAVAVPDLEPEPEPEPAVPLVGRAARAGRGAFPIPDYDNLKALEILGRLSDLDADQLEVVRQREQQGARRAMILHRIDRLLEDGESEVSDEPIVVGGVGDEPEPAVASGRRSRAAKRPVTKRGAGVKKAAAGAGRGAKAPARTGPAATRAPVAKKAAVAKKVPVKKAPVAKKAAPVKKGAVAGLGAGRGAGGAAKVPVTKAPVVKKATRAVKTKKASKRL